MFVAFLWCTLHWYFGWFGVGFDLVLVFLAPYLLVWLIAVLVSADLGVVLALQTMVWVLVVAGCFWDFCGLVCCGVDCLRKLVGLVEWFASIFWFCLDAGRAWWFCGGLGVWYFGDWLVLGACCGVGII